MDSSKGPYGSIDAYIAAQPPEVQETLRKLRDTIREAAPEAGERIAYQMPTFALHGNLVHFAVHKHHIGLYPTPSAIDAFRGELAEYVSAKGSVQFPLDKPIPYDLVARIVRFRVAENRAKAEGKRKRK